MAHYYNLLTHTNGTIMVEEVQKICSVEGQSVQLVVEDVNNDGNNSQQFLTYKATPQNSGQATCSQQINLASQISATQLEQGQNVYIIKTNTNELPSSPGILRPSTVNTVEENTVDTRGSKTLLASNNGGQQLQWIKMQENSNANTISKQGALISEKTQTSNLNENQNSPSSQTLSHGLCDSHISPLNTVVLKRKPLRSYQNRNQFSLNSGLVGISPIPDKTNIINHIANPTANTNVSNIRASVPSFCNKTASPIKQNVTQISTKTRTSLSTVHSKPLAPALPKSSLQLQQQPKMETRLKQLQNEQRLQGSNLQQTSKQASLTSPLQQQTNSPSSQSQVQKQTSPQKSQYEQSYNVSSKNSNDAMDVEPLESSLSYPEEDSTHQSSQTDENSSSSSIAFLQKVIHNPSATKVQVEENTAKMLLILSDREKLIEQRLIGFNIPNEDCTVQDLLDQARITYSEKTNVYLVSDATLGINYIVEATTDSVSLHSIGDTEESPDNSNVDSSHSSPDENVNPVQQNEEPQYVEGMLAVCSHCGISSIDFNRCSRCRRKLPKDVKAIPSVVDTQEKKQSMISVDTFYKKNNERSFAAKLEKLDQDALKRKRGKGKCISKPKPIHKEPECLTISSDEDDEDKSKKSDGLNISSFTNDLNNSFNEEMETILEKEPVITNNPVSNTNCDYTMEDEDMSKDNDIGHTSILCRTVRIGSYKYIPREKVVITYNSVKFGVPLLEDENSYVTLEIKIQDVVKLLIHFGKAMPVLFFYTSISTGAMIRELLGMQDPKGPYYDPAGKDHTHKRITLLPEILSEESKFVLKSLFSSRNLLEELNAKEANDILVRASPKDMQSLSRRESQTGASLNLSVNGGIQTITVYPPPPAKGGIAINTEDYLCLGEDQFLNDVIIDFYLKYLTLEVLSETDHHRTHVFSSYFYKRLTSPHTQAAESNNVPLSPATKRHARVQKWTKNVNIFEKDFIIIPINEHAHWFLAIICFPGLVGEVIAQSKKSEENDIRKTVQKSKKLKEMKLQTVTIRTFTPATTTITIDQGDDGSERDEAEGDDEEMEMDSDDDDEPEATEDKISTTKNEQNVPQNGIIKVPCILIFDSLAGASRSRVVATLRDYLSCEYMAKMGSEKTFSKDTIKGASLKVPQQSNYTDCGLYVLQYVESFFKNPIKDYTLPIKTLKNWFEEIVVTRKREELSELLIKLMNATRGDRNITIPTLNFPTQDGILKAKPENHVDTKTVKTDTEDKKKVASDGEIRTSNNTTNQTESTELPTEVTTKTTYQIIPYSPTSSNSSEGNTEMLTETKPTLTRSSSETMSYLKSKRIPRLALKTENQNEQQVAKKHKGESYNCT